MKRLLTLVLGAVFTAPLIFFSFAAAESGSRTNANSDSNKTIAATTATSSTTTSADSAENEQEIKDTATDTIALKTRLEARKKELKTAITAAETARIKTKCTAAQGNISSLRGKIKGIETSRTAVYDNLLDRLTNLSTKLKDRGTDSSKLDAEIAELKTQVDTFQADLGKYKQAVTDLAAMDCKSNPTAFKASLEAARNAQTQTRTDATAIKSYVNDTIKVTLGDIRSQLEKQSGSTSTTGGTN